MVLEPSSERALRTATEVVEDLGLRFADAIVLRDQSNLLVHFRPTPVVARIATGTVKVRPGSANLSNARNTPSGPVWTDWEDTFEGPREWDLACLVARSRVLDDGVGRAEEALAAYDGDVDGEVLDQLVEARALQVAVWLALGSLSLSAEDGRLEERLAWLRAQDSEAARETGERSADGEDE